MPVTRENLLRHELIGLDAKVVNSSVHTLLGVQGKVVDETKGTLVIAQDGKSKVVPKSSSSFVMILPKGVKVTVDGKKILGRPEDRIKKARC